MTKAFFTLAEIAASNPPDLPNSVRALAKRAEAEGWRDREGLARLAPGKTRPVWEYHISQLPPAAQARLSLIHSAPANSNTDPEAEAKKALWARFEALSSDQKAICRERLAAVERVERYRSAGLRETEAIQAAAADYNVSAASLFSWRGRLTGVDRNDWLAALAPSYRATAERADCHPDAWAALKSDFLRPEKPGFSSCYRRMAKAANAVGWAPIPSERALRRRLDAEVPRSVQVLARERRDRAKNLYPAQRRTRTHLHAMQMVNMDGHKFDVRIELPGGERITRIFLIGIQDLYSGKVLAWRLALAENKESVRLVIGDMVERHGIPDDIYLDNGRAFASKWITGGARTRYRFKVREEEPLGLVTALGIEPHWTTPYAGQSKPIERAWRDLAEEIAKHPFCAGAYTGRNPQEKPENYGSRAIPLEDFRRHVARQIEEHNSRAGRSAAACAGRSFDETFEASLAEPSTLVKWPSPAQAALWLLAAEQIRARKGSGEIHLMGNRYWAPPLNAHAGRLVTVRFDPEHLARGVKVYDGDDRLICDAEPVVDVRFDDAHEARRHARNRNDFMRAVSEQKRLHRVLSAEELASLYDPSTGSGQARPERPRPPKVQRLATGGLSINPSRPGAAWDDQAEEDFGKAMRRIADIDNIIEFAPKSSEYGAQPSSQASAKTNAAAQGRRKK